MKRLRVLFLSVQPLVLAALISSFSNNSILSADFDDYSKTKKSKILVDTGTTKV